MYDPFLVWLLKQSMYCKNALVKQVDSDQEDLHSFEKYCKHYRPKLTMTEV
jgi:hypothetical protein